MNERHVERHVERRVASRRVIESKKIAESLNFTSFKIL